MLISGRDWAVGRSEVVVRQLRREDPSERGVFVGLGLVTVGRKRADMGSQLDGLRFVMMHVWG